MHAGKGLSQTDPVRGARIRGAKGMTLTTVHAIALRITAFPPLTGLRHLAETLPRTLPRTLFK